MRKITSISILFLIPFFIYAQNAVFTTDLYFGIKHPEVKILQKVLNKLSGEYPALLIASVGPGSSGNETDYFGQKTLLAVKAFQELYRSEILSPSNLLSPTGFVGPLTRKKLNSLNMPTNSSAVNSSIVSSAPTTVKKLEKPQITSIYPTSGKNGTKVTLTGKGFYAPSNNVIVSFEDPSKYLSIPTNPDGTITFTLDSTLARQFNEKTGGNPSEKVKKFIPQKMGLAIAVKIGDMVSNSINFDLELY